MLIPRYWAEARVRHREGNRQITIRRFGWSDTGQEDAQAMAEARANDALQRAIRGDVLVRRELSVPYNGVGIPIREEIVDRFGQAVVTRNAYGARCLNTPNVLFADIDSIELAPRWLQYLVSVAAGLLGVLVFWRMRSAWGSVVVICVAYAISNAVVHVVYQRLVRGSDRPARRARARIASFVAAHPGWGVRVYQTPSGIRAMATHQPFTPNDPMVHTFFDTVGVDKVYAQMCANQQCFRARLTPKPWRIGMTRHIKPRSGAWPVPPEQRPVRDAWIAEYEAASLGYAACRFLETVGSTTVHIDIEHVRRFHDDTCRALDERLPIA